MNPTMEPPFIPAWPGYAPLRYWVSPEMQQFRPEILIALLTFTREPVWLRLEEIQAPGQHRSIDFRLAPLVGLLGLGMYPPDLNAEPASGDVTLNSLVDWRNPRCREMVLAVLIHELFHALGFGHFYDPSSRRFPNIAATGVNLSAEDRAALLTMYGR